MRVLVTGARGLVGRSLVPVLRSAGYDVTATDLASPQWGRRPDDEVPYVRADLTDAGEVYALVGGGSVGARERPGPFDAVVHAAAIPEPGKHAPHVVFGNNLMSAFNIVEACVRWGVGRLVNFSSETVPGFIFAERPFLPDYLPVDEQHPIRPQDPYALAKHFGEQLCDAAVRRSELRCTTIRPSWVQDADTYPRNLEPMLRDRSTPNVAGWPYIDAFDLAEAVRLALETDLDGHEVFYIAAPDTIGGRDLHQSWKAAFPDSTTELRPVSRPDASGLDCGKAERLLGWRATRTWRDYLDDNGDPL